jgi:hypothetical protein
VQHKLTLPAIKPSSTDSSSTYGIESFNWTIQEQEASTTEARNQQIHLVQNKLKGRLWRRDSKTKLVDIKKSILKKAASIKTRSWTESAVLKFEAAPTAGSEAVHARSV